ncbi:unnamed protein product [Camellia sinensis]
MDSGSASATAKVQHLIKASSDELLRKFAEVGSGSKDKHREERAFAVGKTTPLPPEKNHQRK